MYVRIIKQPVSFLTIKDLIRPKPERKIRTYEQLGLAFDLMAANSDRFNGAASEFSRVARSFRHECDRVVALQKGQHEARLQQSLLREAEDAELGARRSRAAAVVENLPKRCARIRCVQWRCCSVLG
jgi:hypothetical protein